MLTFMAMASAGFGTASLSTDTKVYYVAIYSFLTVQPAFAIADVSGSGFIFSFVCNATALILCRTFLNSQVQVVVQVCRL